jgi:hypothetical protein
MYPTNQRTLTQPQHAFDLPRVLVWTLAGIGRASLTLAHSLDATLARPTARHEMGDRPRARLGPSQSQQAAHLIPDSWKVR